MHVVVVGAGVTGLAAARRLVEDGAKVTVLEATGRVGGQLRTVDLDGCSVDMGAESLFTAAPGPLELLDELGLAGEVVGAQRGTTWIWSDRGLRPLPEGFGPAGPTRLWPVLRSGVLSPGGVARAAVEPLVPANRGSGDVSVGLFLERRFGRQVTDRLVDPVLGSLHSGDVRRLSLRAATPTLAAMADRRRSLVMRRRPSPHTGPTFVTLRGGLGSLPERLRATLADVEVRPGCSVLAVERHGGALRLHLEDGTTLAADGVVLAVPARAARHIVADASPVAGAELARLRAASVAVAVLAYPAVAAATPALAGTGVLVPSSHQRLLKAATFLSTKWPHHGGQGRVLVRASAGRAGDERAVELTDEELVAGLHADLREATGVTAEPFDARVQRWRSSLPQLEVGHVERIGEVAAALRRDLPGVVLAGAPYDGPGVAACLRSAATAAQQILDHDKERVR